MASKKEEKKLNVGERIKLLRISQKRTLQELADCCDLSKSMVSKIENDKTIPSVASLVKIAKALGTNISDLLEQGSTLNPIHTTKQNAEANLVLTEKGYSIFPYGSSYHEKKMQPFLFTAKRKNVKPHLLSHDGEEFIYVIRGEMKMKVGKAEYLLKEGDSLYFNALQKHGIMPVTSEVIYLDIFV